MMRYCFFTLFLFPQFLFAGTYYVAPNGDDRSGNGSEPKPWATVKQAIDSVPDNGATIIVKDGVYTGFTMWNRQLTQPCTVKAEHPYYARFTPAADRNTVLYLDNLSNVIFDGLHFYGSGGTAGEYLVQLGSEKVHHLAFQNCIFHDSYRNDLLKINHLTNHIRFTNCIFFNPNNHGGDEHFDINTVRDIVIEDSIFFNDFAGSGRAEDNKSHSFIVIKNSEEKPNVTQYITFRRNVFLNWSGLPDQAYILLGEDNKGFFEATDILIENNLFLHNQTVRTVGTFLFKGGLRKVTVRSNTITGEPFRLEPGLFGTYAVAFWKFDKNLPQEDILFANNIFSNNSGSTLRFSAGKKEYFAENGFRAVNNVYWNGGKQVQADPQDIFVPKNDPKAITASPKLPDVPKTLQLPRFDVAKGAFPSGNTTIRQEFERIVQQYAVPQIGSSALDTADPQQLPKDDILGRKRNSADAGCYSAGK